MRPDINKLSSKPLLNYMDLLERLRAVEEKKLGYPESMLNSYKDKNGERLIDNSILGIQEDSIADKLILNVGDPAEDCTTFTMEVKDFERNIFELLSEYFGLAPNILGGYVTSGGTESNFVSLWWACRALKNINQPLISQIEEAIDSLNHNIKLIKSTSNINSNTDSSQIYHITEALITHKENLHSLLHPFILSTETHTHYSIKKIADQLSLPYLTIKATSYGAMDIEDLEKVVERLISANPYTQLIISANIGTTVLGAIDPIPLIKKRLDAVLSKHKTYTQYTVHADAALLGMTLPILKPFGELEDYFRAIGINTLAISGHKFLGTSQVCGLALTTKDFLKKAFPVSREVGYIGKINDFTFAGCRSGLLILQLHNALRSLGVGKDWSILSRIIQDCIVNANYLYHKLIDILGHNQVRWLSNQFNVVFKRPSDKLMKKYQLMPYENKAVACVLSNVQKPLIDSFILDFNKELKRK